MSEIEGDEVRKLDELAQHVPMIHDRSVPTGIEGSSVFETADRTSGYGESSSTTAWYYSSNEAEV